MDQSEIMTAEGEGIWGGMRYRVQLLTFSRTYSDSTHAEAKTVLEFVLAFGSDSQMDRRRFRSNDARRSFMEQSFRALVLREIPESKREPQRMTSPVQAAVGEYLSSVTFVMDYLQLGFSDYGFNMYSWPILTIASETLTHTKAGYKDAMCSLIGETITRIDEYLDLGLTLRFKNGASISLPLRVGRDFPGPEIAEFHGPEPGSKVIWQAGDAPFD